MEKKKSLVGLTLEEFEEKIASLDKISDEERNKFR